MLMFLFRPTICGEGVIQFINLMAHYLRSPCLGLYFIAYNMADYSHITIC